MRDPLRLFVGYDHREAAGLHAFIESLLEHASGPVALTVVTPKIAEELGVFTDGTNAFSKSRFLPPYWCKYQGRSVWMDGADMLMRTDIWGLVNELDSSSPVHVVKHDYTPKAERKYLGTEMEAPNVAYPRKNWSSVMVFWNAHSACRRLTPEYVADNDGQHLHRLAWADDYEIGALPAAWNHLDEYGESAEAKVVHYTNGIPGFFCYKDAPHAHEWRDAVRRMTRGLDGN